jgi:hypothetical protein
VTVCIPTQDAVSVSQWETGEIVIEQPGDPQVSNLDSVLVVQPNNLSLLIAALQALLPEAES